MKTITWIINKECNFNCHFCNSKGETTNYDPHFYLKIISFINFIIGNNKDDYEISLYGGEPTLHPGFFHIIKSIKSNDIFTLSNMSFNQDFLYEVIKYKHHRFIATYHSDFMDSDEFYYKIDFLVKNNIRVKINLIFEDIDYTYIMSKYYNLYMKLKLLGLDIRHQANDRKNYDVKIEEKFSESVSLKKIGLNLKYNECYNKYVCIDHNGDVYMCMGSSRQTDKNKSLYNIFDNNSMDKHKMFLKSNLVCLCDWCCGQ
jgi:organic radical activating enzyme